MRKHSRINTITDAKVMIANGVHYTCVLHDVSGGGAKLSCDSDFAEMSPVGAHLILSIPLVGHETMTVNCRVLRHTQTKEGRYELAMELEERSPELEETLTIAIEESLRRANSEVVGNVRGALLKKGILDLDSIANEVQRVRDTQAARHLFSADHYSVQGVDSTTEIITGDGTPSQECILWSVNLYLGLNRNQTVLDKSIEALESFGTGSGSSAPSGGMSSLHRDVERRIAQMLKKERAILFPTGYTANLGALSSLPGPDDLVIFDRESHASIIDGCRLSGRRWITFEHNNVEDLKRKLSMAKERHPNIFVVVESAYSMSGDLCPLKEIVALKQAFGFYLYVDEAHSFGFYGPNGSGYCVEQGVADEVDFIMTTLSKATASCGGIIAAKEKFCIMLQASARSYIFQATMTPSSAATVLAALDEIQHNPAHAELLHASSKYMRGRLIESGFNLGKSKSPVIPIYVSDVEKLNALNIRLHRDGIYTVVVVFPAVEVGTGRLRFIVTARHTREQIDRTVDCLTKHAQDMGIIQPSPGS